MTMETIALNCLVFEKIAFCVLATDRQTNRQTDEQMHEAALAVESGNLISVPKIVENEQF